MQQNQHLVENRTCRDVIWQIQNSLCHSCGLHCHWCHLDDHHVFSFENVEEVKGHKLFPKTHENTFIYGLMSILAACVASSALRYYCQEEHWVRCVDIFDSWTIVLHHCTGIHYDPVTTNARHLGPRIGLAGVCLLACVICCYKDMVPMTWVELHPSILTLGVISFLLAAPTRVHHMSPWERHPGWRHDASHKVQGIEFFWEGSLGLLFSSFSIFFPSYSGIPCACLQTQRAQHVLKFMAAGTSGRMEVYPLPKVCAWLGPHLGSICYGCFIVAYCGCCESNSSTCHVLEEWGWGGGEQCHRSRDFWMGIHPVCRCV